MEAKTPFIPDTYYHLYNHANGDDNLFRIEDNYLYFLHKYSQYLSPVLDTYSYCLMPNHFHFLVCIKAEKELIEFFKNTTAYSFDFENPQSLSDIVNKKLNQQFSNFLNSYAKAYNKMFARKGSVFRTNIKRKVVNNVNYFTKLIHYIHSNPVHHGFVDNINDWRFSSYQTLCTTKATRIERDKVLTWFGGAKAFIEFHQQSIYTQEFSNDW